MRQVKAKDAFRHIAEKAHHWPIKINNFSFNEIPGVGTGQLNLQFPLNVITGANSIGKTTILRSIWYGLDPEAASRNTLTKRKILSGRVEIEICLQGTISTISQTVNHDEENTSGDIVVNHIDCADAINSLQQKVFALGTAADIVNGAPEKDLSEADLLEVRRLARKDYNSIKVYEIEVESEVFAPFFEVVYEGTTYDSTHMGSGEYSSLFAWWVIDGCPKQSILLVEEPETFLSSLSQISLLEFLAVEIDRKKLCAVITTHSGHLLHNLPKQCVNFLSRKDGNCQFVADRPHPRMLEAVGIYLKADIFIYVEDQAAKLLGELILSFFEPEFASRCDLRPVGGSGEINRKLGGAADNPFGIKFVAWYDGDQRGKIPETVERYSAFLPGSPSIEASIAKYVKSEKSSFADCFGVDATSVLSSLEGLDPHDWILELGKTLQIGYDHLLSKLLDLWIVDAENYEAAKSSYIEFKQIALASS